MKFALLVIFALLLGYGFYWTFLSRGAGLLKPYLGYSDYHVLRSSAWLRFLVMSAIWLFGIMQSMDETRLVEATFVPTLALGYFIGHVHFLCISQEKWEQ